MNAQHEPGPGDRLTMGGTFNGLTTFAHALSLAFLPFLRTDFGKEGIGKAGMLTGLIILGWGSVTNCPEMFGFFALWVVALACQRARQFRNWKNRVPIHSRYTGDPWVSRRLFPKLSHANARAADGFLCLVVGGVVVQFNPPLGWFIVTGFVAILLVEGVMVEATRRKLQAMRDAEIEQEYLADRYQNDRF